MLKQIDIIHLLLHPGHITLGAHFICSCFSHCQLDLHFFQKQRKNAAVKEAKVAGKREFRCRKCDKVFAYKARLRFHMKSHKTEKALLSKSLKMQVQTEVPAHTMDNFHLDIYHFNECFPKF